jgi:hypothetical protein
MVKIVILLAEGLLERQYLQHLVHWDLQEQLRRP